MKVQIYRNLRTGNFSVRDAKTRKVITHLDSFILRDVKYKVSEAGRQRVLKEKRKNVHAWVEGSLVSKKAIVALNDKDRGLWEVRYDPYKRKYFYMYYNGELKPVRESTFVWGVKNKLYAMPWRVK